MKIIESIKPADQVRFGLDELMALAQAQLQTTHGLQLERCVRAETHTIDPLGGAPYLAGSLTFTIKPESK